ncbi:MAG: hypothetical protein K2W96_13100 [Gemmataceae bacterium]|nr:hypothetical protein [Gemmataceae bacterium]
MNEFKRITMKLTGAVLLLLAMVAMLGLCGDSARAGDPCQSYAVKRHCKWPGCTLTLVSTCPSTTSAATCNATVLRSIEQNYYECAPYVGDLYPECVAVTGATVDCTKMRKCKFFTMGMVCLPDADLDPCQSPYYTTEFCED